jgi:glyceraldehyde-3-phosphate dehydrogenase/erythrose-4-phosphate dehydrogenase
MALWKTVVMAIIPVPTGTPETVGKIIPELTELAAVAFWVLTANMSVEDLTYRFEKAARRNGRKKAVKRRAWWRTPLMPALGRQRQADF